MLAVIVFPIMIAVADEVIRAVPQGLREASLALGATRWQTIKHVILRHSLSGIIAAVEQLPDSIGLISDNNGDMINTAGE